MLHACIISGLTIQQLVCSSLRRTIFLTLNIIELPVVVRAGLEPYKLYSIQYFMFVGHSCSALVWTVMLVKVYRHRYVCYQKVQSTNGLLFLFYSFYIPSIVPPPSHPFPLFPLTHPIHSSEGERPPMGRQQILKHSVEAGPNLPTPIKLT